MKKLLITSIFLLAGILLFAQDTDIPELGVSMGTGVLTQRQRRSLGRTIIQTNKNTDSIPELREGIQTNTTNLSTAEWENISADTIQTKHIKFDPAKERILFFDFSKMKKGVGNPPADGVEQGFATLDFDKTTDEEVFGMFFGPSDWAVGSDADVRLGFFVSTAPAAADTVVWGIEFKSIASTGVFNFTSTTTVLDSVQITAGTPANDKKVHNAILNIPSGDLIEGGILMLRIYRDANNGADSHDADARIFDIHIRYDKDRI